MQSFMVYLIVAIGVGQHEVVVGVIATEVFGVQVEHVPTRFSGDRLAAVRALALLSAVKIR